MQNLCNQITLEMIKWLVCFGNDFTQNFYQVEIPLKVTTPSSTSGTNCSALSAK
jgi:hypothetical protein